MVPRCNTLYLSDNVFSTQALIGDTISTSPTGEGQPFYVVIRATEVASFLSYFKIVSIGPPPGTLVLTHDMPLCVQALY